MNRHVVLVHEQLFEMTGTYVYISHYTNRTFQVRALSVQTFQVTKQYIIDILLSYHRYTGCENDWAYLALHNCTVKHAQATTQTYIRDT